MDNYALEESEINALVLMVTNAGAACVLTAIADIAEGFMQTTLAVSADKTFGNKTAVMWQKIDQAARQCAKKVDGIERTYRAHIDTQNMIQRMIDEASKKNAEASK